MQAVEYARAGNGPSIIECKTFRSYGHGDHDDDRAAKYRPKELVEAGRSRDPIAICKKRLMELGYLTKAEAEKYKAEGKGVAEATDEDFPPRVIEYVKKGIDFAIKSPVPPAEEGGMWVFRD
jgi:TPP-dependent pyruvate/acetoin dehydrogenase alpha subunit